MQVSAPSRLYDSVVVPLCSGAAGGVSCAPAADASHAAVRRKPATTGAGGVLTQTLLLTYAVHELDVGDAPGPVAQHAGFDARGDHDALDGLAGIEVAAVLLHVFACQ